jgi:hypothetical protein
MLRKTELSLLSSPAEGMILKMTRPVSLSTSWAGLYIDNLERSAV